VNPRGITRLALPACGLALSAAVACGAQELRTTDTVVTAASSIESAALTSDDGGGVIAGQLAISSATSAQSMGVGGCERERRPNCNRPGRRSTHR
jgi:hypothetical protein